MRFLYFHRPHYLHLYRPSGEYTLLWQKKNVKIHLVLAVVKFCIHLSVFTLIIHNQINSNLN